MSDMDRYIARLAHEQQMADTVAVGSGDEVRALTDANALLKRSLALLTKRIEELETSRETWRQSAAAHAEASRAAEQRTATPVRLDRIATVLRTFYFAQVSLSSIQPIIALACELNPDLVEQRR